MKTVAIIDDDVYIGDMLCTLLKGEGYDVVRAYSGTEALMLLSQSKPDLVLIPLNATWEETAWATVSPGP